MSDFIKPEYCMTCRKVTNHHWMDDTPSHHQYTAECEVCGTRTLGTEHHNIDVDNLVDLRQFDRLNRPKMKKHKPKRGQWQ